MGFVDDRDALVFDIAYAIWRAPTAMMGIAETNPTPAIIIFYSAPVPSGFRGLQLTPNRHP